MDSYVAVLGFFGLFIALKFCKLARFMLGKALTFI